MDNQILLLMWNEMVTNEQLCEAEAAPASRQQKAQAAFALHAARGAASAMRAHVDELCLEALRRRQMTTAR